MNLGLYAAFVVATLILMVVPGPNVLLIVSHSLRRGCRSGLKTVAGTTAAMAVQLAIAVGGLASLMLVLARGLEWLRWAGVIYLVYLGVDALGHRETGRDWGSGIAERNGEALRGFLVALANPKTMLFFAAFLPQFVDPAHAPGTQLAVLTATTLLLAVLVDCAYACVAAHLRGWLQDAGKARVLPRLTGVTLLGTALGLALSRRA